MIDEKGIGNFIDVSEVGVAESLVGFWPLDGNALDFSGELRHGEVYGAFEEQGFNQRCYFFDGINDRIEIEEISFTSSEEWSLNLWIKEESTSGTVFILGDKNSSTMALCFLNEGVYYRASDSTYLGGYSLDRGSWNSIGITYGAGTLSFYINGQLVGQEDNTTDAVFNCIGSAYPDLNYLFGGKIQNLRIFNRKLSPEEVLINYEIEAKISAIKKDENGKVYISGEIREV